MVVAKSSCCSTLKCKIQVTGAKNIERKQKGNLFVRWYLSGSARIHVDTNEISSSSCSKNDDFVLKELSLECKGTEECMRQLKEDTVTLELRQWKKVPLLGKMGGWRSSQVVATGEMPWKNVLGAPNREIETWIVMSNKAEEGDDKPMPALQVAMKVVQLPPSLSLSLSLSPQELRKRRRTHRLSHAHDSTCCTSPYTDCSSCVDNQLLFLADAFQAF